MVMEPRRVPKQPGMSRGGRVFLVLLLWVLILAMALGGLFPELNLPFGYAGGPPVLLVGIFIVVWIVALLQVSAKAGYALAGLLLIAGPVAGPMTSMAAAEIYADAVLIPETAVVIASHPRDDSPVPTDFRFADGTEQRGVWRGVSDCGRVDCYHQALAPGTGVEVDRDPAGRIPPRGPASDLTVGEAAGWWAILAGSAAVTAATSVSVITRRRSLLQRSDDDTEAERRAAAERAPDGPA